MSDLTPEKARDHYCIAYLNRVQPPLEWYGFTGGAPSANHGLRWKLYTIKWAVQSFIGRMVPGWLVGAALEHHPELRERDDD